MPEAESNPGKATLVAARLAALLDDVGVDYAFGGAIALAFAGEPRATIDVDMTLFVDPPEPAACVDALERVGCSLQRKSALESLAEHGFCRVQFDGLQVDVFLPTIPFHQAARDRRLRVKLLNQDCYVYSPEAVTVLKLMFFREKDFVDVKQILRVQGDRLDREWVREQLVEIFGRRDPRVTAWDDIAANTPPD